MKTTALIVTFNRLAKLKDTVKATRMLPFQHIVIVDNASSDGTANWLSSLEDERITILYKSQNDGGAGGFRYGAEFISKNLKTDWVLFYDDDAYPVDNFLDTFAKINAQADTIYCSLVKNKNGEVCKMNLPWTDKTRTISDNINYFREPSRYIVNPQEKSEVISFSFVGCIIHADIVANTFEYIKKELFLYYDDVYYANYLNSKGHKIVFNPNLEFIHDVSVNPAWNSQEWKVYYLSRNLFLSKSLFNVEYYSNVAKLCRLIKYTLVGLSCKNKIKYYSFLIKGIVHGVKKISGCNH